MITLQPHLRHFIVIPKCQGYLRLFRPDVAYLSYRRVLASSKLVADGRVVYKFGHNLIAVKWRRAFFNCRQIFGSFRFL